MHGTSTVIPAEREAREPGFMYPCRANGMMPGYWGPRSARARAALALAPKARERDDSRVWARCVPYPTIACGRRREVFFVIALASSRTERPHGLPAAIHEPSTV